MSIRDVLIGLVNHMTVADRKIRSYLPLNGNEAVEVESTLKELGFVSCTFMFREAKRYIKLIDKTKRVSALLDERFLSISFYNVVKPKDKVVSNIVDALNEIEGSRIGTRVVVPSIMHEFDKAEVLILLQSYGYKIVKDHGFDLINILKVKGVMWS
ncbi:hypothetical protein SUSAZ_01155 [Sulfolobus acidocaldarius SUSAZ]|nr:hypothetical protein SUSAZ_01155 [Sulfolobus acidocaldarius SUSAZ]